MQKPPSPPARAPRVTPERFVVAWRSSRSIAEAAAALGMTPNAVRARASRYRRLHGVRLAHMPGRGKAIDAAALNALLT